MAAAPIVAASNLPSEWEKAFDEYCKLPSKIVPVLEQVKDRKTADEAAPKIRSLLQDVYNVCNAIRSIRQISEQQSTEIRNRYEQTMRNEWGKVYQHIFRLQQEQCFESLSFNKEFQLFCLMLEQ